jgi:hypothetical protein
MIMYSECLMIMVSEFQTLLTPTLHSASTRTYVKLCDETAKIANGRVW